MALPFLTYVTVFKSRLGLANIVLDVTGFGNQSAVTVTRKVRQTLEAKEVLEVTARTKGYVWQYLLDKKLVGAEARTKGRYAGYTLVARRAVARDKQTGRDHHFTGVQDRYLDGGCRPAVDDRRTHTRERRRGCRVRRAVEADLQGDAYVDCGWPVSRTLRDLVMTRNGNDNPFLLRAEAVALLRQILEADGVMLRAMVPFLVESGPEITRAEVAEAFEAIVDSAVAETKQMRIAPMQLRDVVAFQKLIRDQARKFEAARSKAREHRDGVSHGAPGVLEHRFVLAATRVAHGSGVSDESRST